MADLKLKCNCFVKRSICILDGKCLDLQKQSNDCFGTSINISKGYHKLTVIKKSFYDNCLCYLNIINPVFFFWQLKFLSRWHLGYDETSASVNIDFFVENDNDSIFIELELQKNELVTDKACGNYYSINCKKINNAKNATIVKNFSDRKIAKRFKIVHCASAVFYTVLLLLVSFLKLFNDNSVDYAILIFMFSLILFCINICYRTINTKSINDIIE